MITNKKLRLLLWLVLTFSALNLRAEELPILTITNRFDGTAFITVVRNSDLRSTPSWKRSDSSPPLSPPRAMKMAKDYVKVWVRMFEGDWDLSSQAWTLKKSGVKDKWFYVVTVQPSRTDAKSVVIEPMDIVVLMDGNSPWMTDIINESEPRLKSKLPNVPEIARDCESRIEATIDPIALQAWATNLLARYALSKTNFNSSLPSYPPLKHIWDRDTPSTCTLGGEGEEEFVYIIWGAAMGHWGLAVGSPGFVPKVPEHGGRMWKPGVYFWHQFH